MRLPGAIGQRGESAGTSLLKRIRVLMARDDNVQSRLDQFVRVIASSMKVNVVSIYLRAGDELELCATRGLKQSAVHQTRLKLSEGLVGRVARRAKVLNTANAPDHPDFSYRPETGEDKYQSFLGVPLLRGGRNLGVLVIQNRRARTFSELEVETLLTVATILAEVAIEDERAGGKTARLKGIRLVPDKPESISGLAFADGLVRGHAYFHIPPVAAMEMIAKDISTEENRIEEAITHIRKSVDAMVAGETAQLSRASREIFESYRMFAYDRQWVTRLREAVHAGLTAEAAVERVRNEHRARLKRARDPYLRARLHDLEDLANRMLRSLGGESLTPADANLPNDAILFARVLGPAELLDYNQELLKGVVLEEGAATAHASIICRTLGIPLIGSAQGVLDRVEMDDEVLVDGEIGEVILRPRPQQIEDFSRRLRIRGELRQAFAAQRELPCVTKDGQKIDLMLNAGLKVDLPKIDASGAAGIGLFRTEFQFMIAESMPRLQDQISLYRDVLAAGAGRPITFRTLDLGGDKILPYGSPLPEENPAIGWRAIRIGLDRPALLRYQLRALLFAAAEEKQPLRVMFPMVATIEEFQAAKSFLEKEIKRAQKLGDPLPPSIETGVMLETPALAWQIDAICSIADFVSVGANDLMQFFFAADRDNPRVANRYDGLHPAGLSLLAYIADACHENKVPVSICGEMASRPIEAICLAALGYETLSMPVSGIGPVKSALLALDRKKLRRLITKSIGPSSMQNSLREQISAFCTKHGVPI